ncbi:MAG: hypothetical protein AAF799_19360 [Myxococcota bacterium]
MLLFGVNVAFSMAVWGYVLARWLRPWMARQPLGAALTPILLLHMTRANGAGFVIEGVASAQLEAAMAVPAATGDLLAASLAALALLGFRRNEAAGRAMAWLFTVVGLCDLAIVATLVAAYRVDPGDLGAMYFVVVGVVPGLMLTHLLALQTLRNKQ